MRKWVNAMKGVLDDGMVHEHKVLDELLAWIECPILLLELLMKYCPWPLKIVVMMVAAILTILQAILVLALIMVSAVVMAIAWSIDELRSGEGVMSAIQTLLMAGPCVVLWLGLFTIMSCKTVLGSVWQSSREDRLVYELFF